VNTATASFNTVTGQMTEMSQRKKAGLAGMVALFITGWCRFRQNQGLWF